MEGGWLATEINGTDMSWGGGGGKRVGTSYKSIYENYWIARILCN